MCTNGVNTGQFDDMIDQVDDGVALQYRWAHKLAHRGGDAGYENCHQKLHAACEALSEARALLDEAKQALEADASAASAAGVSATLV